MRRWVEELLLLRVEGTTGGLPHTPLHPQPLGLGRQCSPIWKVCEEYQSSCLLVWPTWASHNGQPVWGHVITYWEVSSYSGNLFWIRGHWSCLFIYLFVYLHFKTRIFSIKTFIGAVGNASFALKRWIVKPKASLVFYPALVSSTETKFQNSVLEKLSVWVQSPVSFCFAVQAYGCEILNNRKTTTTTKQNQTKVKNPLSNITAFLFVPIADISANIRYDVPCSVSVTCWIHCFQRACDNTTFSSANIWCYFAIFS